MKAMDTAITAWRNGDQLAELGFTRGDVETYQAAYIKAFDFGASDRLRAAADLGVLPLIFAIEDADLDRIAASA